MKHVASLCLGTVSSFLMAIQPAVPPRTLPAEATAVLAASLQASAAHKTHVWRDNVPINPDDTVNAFIEISRGDRRKWELDMGRQRRAIDRVIPVEVGGYPVNYGFVPQTVSYDGDPFDALVLGPALEGGQLVRGTIVGLMLMEDEKGLDSKVVLSRPDGAGQPTDELTNDVKQKIGDYFRRYKLHESGKFSAVPGWGSRADGLAFVRTTHAFFQRCRPPASGPCSLDR